MELFTVVHPIAAANPWGAAEGWRWAIHTDRDFGQVERGCLNASWQPSQVAAESELSMVLITVRRALTAAGIKATVAASVLTDCPLTSDVLDELAVLAW